MGFDDGDLKELLDIFDNREARIWAQFAGHIHKNSVEWPEGILEVVQTGAVVYDQSRWSFRPIQPLCKEDTESFILLLVGPH